MSENMEKILTGVAGALIMFVITKIWDRWQNSIRYLEYLVKHGTDGSVKLSIYNRTGKDYSDVELDVYFKDKTDPTREVRPVSYKVSDDLHIVDGAKSAASQGNSRLGLFLKVINRNGLKPFLSVAFSVEGAENIDCILNVIKLGVSTRRVEPIELVPVRKTIMASEAVTAGIATMIGLFVFWYSPQPLPPITKTDPSPVQVVDTTQNRTVKDSVQMIKEIQDEVVEKKEMINPVATNDGRNFNFKKVYPDEFLIDSVSNYGWAQAYTWRDTVDLTGRNFRFAIEHYNPSKNSMHSPLPRNDRYRALMMSGSSEPTNNGIEYIDIALGVSLGKNNHRLAYQGKVKVQRMYNKMGRDITDSLAVAKRRLYYERNRSSLIMGYKAMSAKTWTRADTVRLDSIMNVWIHTGY
jgi:hypothetical protein